MPQIATIQADERRAYTVNEFCKAYRVSRSHVYQLMARQQLRTVRVGGKRLIPVESAVELMNPAAA